MVKLPVEWLTRVSLLVGLALVLQPPLARADSVEEINAKALNALTILGDYVDGSEAFLRSAAGVLVFPDVVKLGFGAGGQYGEGVLLVERRPAAYYATSGAPFGLELGVQFKAEVIVFLSADALQRFRESHSWEAGVDGTVHLARRGSGAGLDPKSIEQDIVGFVFSNEGLEQEPTFEGTRITRLAR